MLNWTNYDCFDWENSKQKPMEASERKEVERMVAEVLEVSDADCRHVWGDCASPGRFAATVVNVRPGVRHRYEEQAKALNISDIGVKVFKANGDAGREGRRVIPYCRELIHRLPGLPNDHIQKIMDAGVWTGDQSKRPYIIQEWMIGENFENLVRRKWPCDPIDGTLVRLLLEQLFGEIILPLWLCGTVWWDFREANYCWDGATRKLSMVDADSLSAYANEILNTPDIWTRREKGRQAALSRLRQMTLRILLAQGLSPKARVERRLKEIWRQDWEPILQKLGREDAPNPHTALRTFLNRLAENKLLKQS